MPVLTNNMLLDCPSNINRVFFNLNKKILTTAWILWHTSLRAFHPCFSGRKNEARGRTSEASADQPDFFPVMGLALPSREGTSSS